MENKVLSALQTFKNILHENCYNFKKYTALHEIVTFTIIVKNNDNFLSLLLCKAM